MPRPTDASPKMLEDYFQFDNSFVKELPADPEHRNFTRQVTEACYSRVTPTPVAKPRLVAVSAETAALLEIPEGACTTPDFAEVFAGNRLLPGMDPFAACYGGHQFGQWAGQLGDGRAISLGETVNSRGERWELQLKGAGPTPYSRSADGRAVMRSSVREFLCSEAMFHLGVPTTRALSLTSTGDGVMRDMFYDGRPQIEPGAIVCRVAPSFIRFGNFEILAGRRETELLGRLARHTIKRHAPQFLDGDKLDIPGWFAHVCTATVEMIIHWMRVGFVHGVMNTDNMSVLGLTIDYGPYGWLDNYDTQWTPNTTDAQGRRYAYGQQPNIALWNLVRFANALLDLVGSAEPLEAQLELCFERMKTAYPRMLAQKLGLATAETAAQFTPSEDETVLIGEVSTILQLTETDMTLFYRRLAELNLNPDTADDAQLLAPLADVFYRPDDLDRNKRAQWADWLRRYLKLVAAGGFAPPTRKEAMNRVNPKYVLRNYLAQEAIDKAEKGDPSAVLELLQVMRAPYDEQPEMWRFAQKRPDWARHRPGCSTLSCSS